MQTIWPELHNENILKWNYQRELVQVYRQNHVPNLRDSMDPQQDNLDFCHHAFLKRCRSESDRKSLLDPTSLLHSTLELLHDEYAESWFVFARTHRNQDVQQNRSRYLFFRE